MRRASAPRSTATAAGSSAARRSPAASSTRCSRTRSTSAASATRRDVHPGQHAAIVDEDLWQAVQDRLASNARATKTRARAKSPSPLAGRLVGPDGQKMRPSHATKNGRRYRYYVSAGLIEGSIATGARGWRIPAAEIEAVVASAIAAKVREPAFLSELLGTDERSRHSEAVSPTPWGGSRGSSTIRPADRSPDAGGDRSARERVRDGSAGRCSICRAQRHWLDDRRRRRSAHGHRLHRGRADPDGPARSGAAADPAEARPLRPDARIRIWFVRSSPRGFVLPTTSHPAVRSASATSPSATGSTSVTRRARCSSPSWRRICRAHSRR